MTENQKIDMRKILILIIFFLSLFGVLMSIDRFKEGIHSVDTASNICYINSITDMELIDIGSDFQVRTGIQLYIIGMNQSKEALGMLLWFSLFLGLSLCELIKGYFKGAK